MSDELVQLHVDNGVAQVVLNRPEKMNSFTGEMHILLRETLARVEANTAIRALVLTGAGRGFCAGQDLADEAVRFTPGEAPPDLGDVVRIYYAPLVMQLSRMRVPTIAAVNGVAAGAGASLAMACDLVVASETASFVIPFAKIGLIPDTGASWHLPRAVGQVRALGLAMTGGKLGAKQAADWGLIWEAVSPDKFEAHVSALAQTLALMPTQALVKTREAMRASATQPLEAHLGLEAEMMSELGRSADYVEGVRAFMEKRPPQFGAAT